METEYIVQGREPDGDWYHIESYATWEDGLGCIRDMSTESCWDGTEVRLVRRTIEVLTTSLLQILD